ncbi:hypothetical protein BYT27DRAFT_7262068 [Phlegmacium glaucopus]|nr:hypothetical protein BYT27DRAFT_7262068 [Phlegmacium glaucopus]
MPSPTVLDKSTNVPQYSYSNVNDTCANGPSIQMATINKLAYEDTQTSNKCTVFTQVPPAMLCMQSLIPHIPVSTDVPWSSQFNVNVACTNTLNAQTTLVDQLAHENTEGKEEKVSEDEEKEDGEPGAMCKPIKKCHSHCTIIQ